MDLIAISNQVTTYVVVCAMPVGVILNSFAFYVFSRPTLNMTNMGLLNRIQLGVDIIVLLSNILLFRTSVLFNFNLYTVHDLICKSLSVYRRSILHISSFTNAFITFDRFVYVHCWSKFKLMKKKRNLFYCLAVIYFLVVCANIVNAFMYLEEKMTIININYSLAINETFVVNSTKAVVTISRVCTSTFEVDLASDIMTLLLRTYIPITFMMSFNFIIIKDMYKSKSKANIKTSRKETQFTLTVIFSNVIFMIFYIPLLVSYILNYVYLFSGHDDSVYKINLDFFYNIALIYAYFYQIFESIIMMLTNNLFRREVYILLRLRPSIRGDSNYATRTI
jgi:hypothetical protein